MATNYPTSLDALTNPTSSDSMSSPSHSGQHADANDAIEALQAKVGVNSSAVTTSLDYRVTQLESGGGSMTTSATAPSSPSDGDMWYDTSTGRTYVYYDDGSSQQWVEFGAAPDAGIMHVSSSAPSSPNAGDMWYDTDDGTTSLYYDDGSSTQWVQFGAAPVTTGSLVFISRTTIGSAVSSVTVSGAFSANYDAYRIIMTGGGASANPDLRLTLGASTTSYYYGLSVRTYGGITIDAQLSNGAFIHVGTSSPQSHYVMLDITNPFAAKETTMTALLTYAHGGGAGGYSGGYHASATSYTDFTITPNTGTLTGGTIDVYGYAKA